MTQAPNGSFTLIDGMRFDREKVNAALERLVDRFTEAFGGGRSTVGSARADATGRFAWPEPGRRLSREFWRNCAELYDVVDEPLVHVVGPLTLKAFLLGKTWCVRHPGSGLITTPEGEDPAELASEPVLCLYGPEIEGGSYRMAEERHIRAAESLLSGELADLRLVLQKSRVIDEGGRLVQVAYAVFPHDVYGAGRGTIRVRCVAPDGSELPPVVIN